MYNASNHVIPPFTATDIANMANENLQEISNCAMATLRPLTYFLTKNTLHIQSRKTCSQEEASTLNKELR